VRLKRKKMGGNKRQKFIDGWVEFCDKKIAKRVALNLNGEPIGGAKSNYWRFTVRPLPF
jgi:ESF2/ABP1 family protein